MDGSKVNREGTAPPFSNAQMSMLPDTGSA